VPLITTIAAAFSWSKNGYSFAGSFENKPTDTPVTAIVQTIEQNLIQMVNEYEFENQEMIELQKSNGSKWKWSLLVL
jgi:putative membrane protein